MFRMLKYKRKVQFSLFFFFFLCIKMFLRNVEMKYIYIYVIDNHIGLVG